MRSNEENRDVLEKCNAVFVKHAWIKETVQTYRELRGTKFRPFFFDKLKVWSLVINDSVEETLEPLKKHFVFFVSADTGDVYTTEEKDPKRAIPVFEGEYANSLNRLVEYVWLQPSIPGRPPVLPLKLLVQDGVPQELAKKIRENTSNLVNRIKEALNAEAFETGTAIKEEMRRCFHILMSNSN